MKSRTTIVLALVAIGTALLVSYHGFFFFRDNFTTHYPMKVISAEAFRAGQIPWWNFHDMGGQPLAGNPNSLTFYPDNVLYLLLPVHVAFNLHFLIHLAGGFAAMRALCLLRTGDRTASSVAAVAWTLSGVVISATAFYNLVTMAALLPLALLAVERRSGRLLGIAFGLMLLGTEPMTMFGAAMAVAIVGAGKMRWTSVAGAVVLAAAIGAPQVIAWSEIAAEVERSVPMSADAMLATSLTPARVAEFFFWPVHGFLNDPGGLRQRLFSTIFFGIIAIPALLTRSRYTLVAAASFFFALGFNNPLVEWAVNALPPALRVVRFPEKLVFTLTAAVVVLVAGYLTRTRFRRAWMMVALVPLSWAAVRALPLDWYAPYRVEAREPARVHWRATIPAGRHPARIEYHQRAANLDWMFGAVAGLRYGIGRSPDNMHSLLSRAVADRFAAVPPPLKGRYLRINACDVPGSLPPAAFVSAVVPARTLFEAVRAIESPGFDEQRFAVAPASIAGLRPAAGEVRRYREDGQTVRMDVATRGTALLMVNQTFFENWVARSGGVTLQTVPLNVDRLGIIVPEGEHEVLLTFGRRRVAVVVSLAVSFLLLAGAAFLSSITPLVQKLDRHARQIE